MHDPKRLFIEALRCHESGHAKQAEEIYRSILALVPHHPDANHNLALILLESGHIEEALHRFRLALEAFPSHPPFWISYLQGLMRVGRREEARQLCDAARRQRIQSPSLEAISSELADQGERTSTIRGTPPFTSPGVDFRIRQPQLPQRPIGSRPTPQMIEELHAYYVAGQAEDAARLSRMMTDHYPDIAFGWTVQGCVHAQKGNFREAATSLYKAASLTPEDAATHNNLGNVLRELGRPEEALVAFREALRLSPNQAEVLANLANALQDLGRWKEAEVAYRMAIHLKPDHPDLYANLGGLLRTTGQLAESEKSCRIALRIRADHREARNHLGNTLSDQTRLGPAKRAYCQTIALYPRFAEAYFNLGALLNTKACSLGAKSAYEKAIRLNPNYVEAFINLGNILQSQQSPLAEESYRKACCIDPDNAQAFNNLGNLLRETGRIIDAECAYRLSLLIDPHHAEGHWNKSLLDLERGNYIEGWKHYEWRFHHAKTHLLRKASLVPEWDGASPLQGKTIRLYAEQGLGDTLQFFRFPELIRDQGAIVTVEVQKELVNFLADQNKDIRVVGPEDLETRTDLIYPLMSLPHALGIDLERIPKPSLYLKADEGKRQNWRKRLPYTKGPRLGITLSGNPGHTNDRHRSLSWDHLLPLLGQGYALFSLQNEVREGDRPFLMQHPEIYQPLNRSTDFAETAALCMEMDLIISVDTSIAHLAAGLGKDTWILLPFNADWRWLRDRQDSPWYTAARLFRQNTPGDWASVIHCLTTALERTFD